MKQIAKWPLFAIVLLAVLGSSAPAATPLSGTISGTVKDADGHPLAGALISVHDIAATADEVLKLTKTDKNGHFLAADLSPGHYALRATALGYKTEFVAQATVSPHQTAVFNFTLRRVSELLNSEQDAESYKYIIRRNRTIFQLQENMEPVIAEDKKPFIRQTHGLVQFAAQGAASSLPGAGNFAGFNFAISENINENLDVVVAGQTGIGRISPQQINTQATLLAGDNHQLTFDIGYGHLPAIATLESNPQGLNQYSLHATDKWHIAGPVVILYGFDYLRYDGIGHASHIAPRANICLQATPRDQFFAAIYSPSGADIESSEEFETTKVDFHGPVELIDIDPQKAIDNSRRYEFGYTHTFKDRSSLETAVFWDNISGHTVGILTAPGNPEPGNNENDHPANGSLSTIEQNGQTHGLRVIFTHPINNNISASLGYAFGQGQRLSSVDGRANFSVGYFQVITGKVDAQLVSSGTHISAVFRLSSPQAVLAIDPFQQKLGTIDPNISIYLTQAMPMFSFIPGRWEATLDARNLLDSSNGDDRARLAIGQYWRSIRGGFSVRF
jgi:hypothetical protein